MEPVVFRRWGNKGWSAFASLHRVIIIATLSVSYQMPAQDLPEGRTDSTTRMVELEEVEATASAPADLEEISLQPVLVYSSGSIAGAAAQSHDDLLETVPGLDIRQRGMHGTQADLGILGGTFDQSLVLLNGINLSDPQSGHFLLNVPIPLFATHRVEVLGGAASRTFGSHAFTGAVNLVSLPADTTRLAAGIRAGQYGLYQAHALLNLAGTRSAGLLAAGTSGSDGYRPNTDFRRHDAFMHLRTGTGKYRNHLILGLNRRLFGANSFYSPRFPDQYEETLTGLAALKSELEQGHSHIAFSLYIRFNRDHFLLDRHNPAFYQNDHLSHAGGLDLSIRHSWMAGVSRAGLGFRQEGIVSTSLGEPLEEERSARWNDSLIFSHGSRRQQFHMNFNHHWQLGPLALSGGFLLHLDPGDHGLTGLYPGLDARLSLGPRTRIHASVNRSMRMPTFTDLYYQGPSNQGNPSLNPEKAVTLEAGIYRETNWILGLSTWYRAGQDLIDWVWMEDDRWHTKNYSRLRAMGGTFRAGWTGTSKTGSTVHLQEVDFSYNLGHQVKLPEVYISRYLLDYLRHKLVLRATLALGRQIGVSLVLNGQDRMGSFMSYDASNGESQEQDYDPFLRVDVKLDYHLGRVHFFTGATNLFNAAYYDLGNVIQPGRWMSAGIEIR